MSKGLVLMMAGGTGGHVIPALSVANDLVQRGYEVEWLGTAEKIEARLVPEAGYRIHYLAVEGVRGRGLRTLIKAPFMLLKAVKQAYSVLRQRQPVAVIGMGGFASGPGGLAAKLLNIPIFIHEQNAVAGTTNRYLSKLTSHVFSAFDGVLANAIVVGNPVRTELVKLPTPSERGVGQRSDGTHVLVLGGSLGALALNKNIPVVLSGVAAEHKIKIKHQCGRNHLSVTQEHYQRAALEADIVPFINDMAGAYEWADVVICRAGALTVSEIATVGLGAILVPFPGAIDDHQTKNAEVLLQANAASIMQQSDWDSQRLSATLSDWISRDNLVVRAEAARTVAINDAAAQVGGALEQLLGKKNV